MHILFLKNNLIKYIFKMKKYKNFYFILLSINLYLYKIV